MTCWYLPGWIVRGGILFAQALACWIGEPNIRRRLRQESEQINADPDNITLIIDQPKACELY